MPPFSFGNEMSKQLIKSDAATGKEVWLHYDDNGYHTVEEKQHVKQVLEQNRVLSNKYERGKLIGNTQRHWQQVADIPNVIYLQLRQKFGEPRDNPKAWRKWLNDYDNRYFRTGGGSL